MLSRFKLIIEIKFTCF